MLEDSKAYLVSDGQADSLAEKTLMLRRPRGNLLRLDEVCPAEAERERLLLKPVPNRIGDIICPLGQVLSDSAKRHIVFYVV